MMPVLIAMLTLVEAPRCDGTTIEVEACLAGELRRADAELNRYYRAAVTRLTGERQPEALAGLRRSERAWIAHRDEECGAVSEYWKGGTIRGAMETRCRITATRIRTAAIWRDWLTYADSTPPILPAPVGELDDVRLARSAGPRPRE